MGNFPKISLDRRMMRGEKRKICFYFYNFGFAPDENIFEQWYGKLDTWKVFFGLGGNASDMLKIIKNNFPLASIIFHDNDALLARVAFKTANKYIREKDVHEEAQSIWVDKIVRLLTAHPHKIQWTEKFRLEKVCRLPEIYIFGTSRGIKTRKTWTSNEVNLA